jgi:hypothetical protein
MVGSPISPFWVGIGFYYLAAVGWSVEWIGGWDGHKVTCVLCYVSLMCSLGQDARGGSVVLPVSSVTVVHYVYVFPCQRDDECDS